MTRIFLSILALLLLIDPAFAQESDRSRERENRDRINRLERQVRQMQERVYPDGAPASTAGYADEPVATRSSVDILTGRLQSMESQLTTLVRQAEEAQYRIGQMEAEISRLRGEMQAMRDTPPPPPQPIEDGPIPVEPDNGIGDGAGPIPAEPNPPRVAAVDPANLADPQWLADGKEAYDAGFRLWDARDFTGAIRQLDAMVEQYPGHPNVSWANNLKGRALLDANRPRDAAEVLLANYRGDPEGARAADSLYFLGQALMRLDQPGQACRAYDELEEVYGGNMRSFITERLPAARSAARCS